MRIAAAGDFCRNCSAGIKKMNDGQNANDIANEKSWNILNAADSDATLCDMEMPYRQLWSALIKKIGSRYISDMTIIAARGDAITASAIQILAKLSDNAVSPFSTAKSVNDTVDVSLLLLYGIVLVETPERSKESINPSSVHDEDEDIYDHRVGGRLLSHSI